MKTKISKTIAVLYKTKYILNQDSLYILYYHRSINYLLCGGMGAQNQHKGTRARTNIYIFKNMYIGQRG